LSSRAGAAVIVYRPRLPLRTPVPRRCPARRCGAQHDLPGRIPVPPRRPAVSL